MESRISHHHCMRPFRCLTCILLAEEYRIAEARKKAPDYVRSLLEDKRNIYEAQAARLKWNDLDVNQIYLDTLTKGCEALSVAFEPIDTSTFSG